MNPEYAYFVQAETSGLIKIGFASDVRSRLSALQTTSPERLVLLGVMGGGRYAEAVLHEAFADLSSHGEWFYPEPRLLAHIALVAGPLPPDGRLTRAGVVERAAAKRAAHEELDALVRARRAEKRARRDAIQAAY